MARTISWILLTVVAVLTLLGSLASAWVAYSGAPDEFGVGGSTVADLAQASPAVATAIRGRRATAAAYAAAYAALLLAIAIGPYRRGERWSLWAVAGAMTVHAVLVLLRVPLLQIRMGIGTAVIQLAVMGASLALATLSSRPPAATA